MDVKSRVPSAARVPLHGAPPGGGAVSVLVVEVEEARGRERDDELFLLPRERRNRKQSGSSLFEFRVKFESQGHGGKCDSRAHEDQVKMKESLIRPTTTPRRSQQKNQEPKTNLRQRISLRAEACRSGSSTTSASCGE